MAFLHSKLEIENYRSTCTLLVGLGYYLPMGLGPYFQLTSRDDQLVNRTLYCFKKSYTEKILTSVIFSCFYYIATLNATLSF